MDSLNFHPGLKHPKPSAPCRQATRRAGGLQPTSTPLDTPLPTPMANCKAAKTFACFLECCSNTAACTLKKRKLGRQTVPEICRGMGKRQRQMSSANEDSDWTQKPGKIPGPIISILPISVSPLQICGSYCLVSTRFIFRR
jgi:hypothetical protein